MKRFALIRAAAICLLASALGAPAFAQGSYVGAFLVGDVVRTDRYDSREVGGGGEAIGFALRLGTPVGNTWGVEVEFVRSGEITSEESPEVFPVDFPVPNIPLRSSVPGGNTVSQLYALSYPSYSFTFRSSQRRTTISPALWVRQEISPRFSLAYLGGVAFGRTDTEVEVGYIPIRPVLPVGISTLPAGPSTSESVDYRVDPMVGVEGRLRMAGQVDLVPSLRLQGIGDGWMIRPAVGLSWNF